MKGIQRWWFRLVGPRLEPYVDKQRYIPELQKADVQLRPEAYLANALLTAGIAFIFTLLLVIFAELVLVPLAAPSYPILGVLAPMFWLLPPVVSGGLYFISVGDLRSRAKKRSKDINLKLPYALNYVAAMASAGVIPTEIFGSLGRQTIYGQVARESAAIHQDIVLFGKDIVTAMRRAIDRSPSTKFQEFLQGAVTTITSGGDLKAYFLEKASRYQWENRQEQKAFIETMGLLAETYVTVAVAGPLFMIVMMAIIALITPAGPTNLKLLVYLLMPIINGGYIFLLRAAIPEV